jgi:hypothetical protein
MTDQVAHQQMLISSVSMLITFASVLITFVNVVMMIIIYVYMEFYREGWKGFGVWRSASLPSCRS